MRRPTPLAVYLSLMIAYGIGNMANDDWYEQVVEARLDRLADPDVLQPSPDLDVGPSDRRRRRDLLHRFETPP